ARAVSAPSSSAPSRQAAASPSVRSSRGPPSPPASRAVTSAVAVSTVSGRCSSTGNRLTTASSVGTACTRASSAPYAVHCSGVRPTSTARASPTHGCNDRRRPPRSDHSAPSSVRTGAGTPPTPSSASRAGSSSPAADPPPVHFTA
ncbi:hypothetical protein DY240_25550, partial [Jiangella rhizosphaerae]